MITTLNEWKKLNESKVKSKNYYYIAIESVCKDIFGNDVKIEEIRVTGTEMDWGIHITLNNGIYIEVGSYIDDEDNFQEEEDDNLNVDIEYSGKDKKIIKKLDELESEIYDIFRRGNYHFQSINESKKLISDVTTPKKNKMHNVLGIDKDTKISDVYTSGKKLAEDLVAKVGKKKATGMLAFVANINKEENIFDRALRALDRVNESEEIKDDDYYAKKYINNNKLITHPDIKSKEDIEKIIESSEGELNTFLKNVAKLDYPVKLSKKRNRYYTFTTDEIPTGSGKFGLFENVIKFGQFYNFGGGEIISTTHKDEFYFNPYIWFGNLTIGYEAQSGGSNGMTYCFYKDDNSYPSGSVLFDILNNKYITRNEMKYE